MDMNVESTYQLIMVVSNFSNKGNMGTLIRAAVANSCSELVLVGSNRFSTHGAHGAQKHMKVVCASNWAEAKNIYIKRKKCEMVCIFPSNIINSSGRIPIPIRKRQFMNQTAFCFALREDEIEEVPQYCDKIMYVPQRCFEDTNRPIIPLEISTVACLVLQHFASWANFNERSTTGYKYDLDEDVKHSEWRVKKGFASIIDIDNKSDNIIQKDNEEKNAELLDEDEDEVQFTSLYGNEDY